MGNMASFYFFSAAKTRPSYKYVAGLFERWQGRSNKFGCRHDKKEPNSKFEKRYGIF